MIGWLGSRRHSVSGEQNSLCRGDFHPILGDEKKEKKVTDSKQFAFAASSQGDYWQAVILAVELFVVVYSRGPVW